MKTAKQIQNHEERSTEMDTNAKQKPFRILSLDGGGVRGILPAQILALMEKELGIDPYDTFDLIVGTSTGSIIAGAIAIKHPTSKFVQEYEEYAPSIFKRKSIGSRMLRSKYEQDDLSHFLHKILGDIKLGDIEKPLILNATNASRGKVRIFKSRYQEWQRDGDYFIDKEVPLFKAALASCAAPTYFNPIPIFNPDTNNEELICDGALWANNPALVAYIDTKKNFRRSGNIRVFSLGTGKIPISYPKSKSGWNLWGWGFLTGWRKEQLVNLALSCQVDLSQNTLDLISSGSIFRIDPNIENYALDDTRKISDLKELAVTVFNERKEEIKNFLTNPKIKGGYYET